MPLRLVGLVNLIPFFLSCLVSILGRELKIIFVEDTLMMACIRIFTNQFLSNLV